MLALINGLILTPTEVIKGKTLLLDSSRIAGIADAAPEGCELLDAEGGYIFPGFIDTHSDGIEHVVLPRQSSPMDFELALRAHERMLAGQGITTMYHSISLYAKNYFGIKEIRKQENTFRFAELIKKHRNNQRLIRHRFHLRIELDNLNAFDIVKDLMERDLVHAISFMDHTPGQGQYRDIEIYRKAISAYDKNAMDNDAFNQIMREHQTKSKLSFEQMQILAGMAAERGLPVASHDDDTLEKLRLNRKLGVTSSEFPITMEIAERAAEMGFSVTAGAPNVLRGGSHSGNMSAAEGVLAGCVHSLCSDYYTISMLQSAFVLHETHGVPLPKAVDLLTGGPARAMKIDRDYGTIEAGKKADLLIVKKLDGYPAVLHTLVDGIPVFAAQYRMGADSDEHS